MEISIVDEEEPPTSPMGSTSSGASTAESVTSAVTDTATPLATGTMEERCSTVAKALLIALVLQVRLPPYPMTLTLVPNPPPNSNPES